MNRVFLIGYMGSGKTTVGKKLAKSLSLSFIDLDDFIQNKYRKTISELFAEIGEEEFRKVESRALREVSEIEDVVISTGGGAPCFFNNMKIMNNAGITLYIEVEPEELAARLLASKAVRPLIVGKSKDELIPFIRKHLSKRECYYRMAQIVYHSEKMITKENIYLTVHKIEDQLKNKLQ
jgi:shikimate kinase